jgi:hypothetical protein
MKMKWIKLSNGRPLQFFNSHDKTENNYRAIDRPEYSILKLQLEIEGGEICP